MSDSDESLKLYSHISEIVYVNKLHNDVNFTLNHGWFSYVCRIKTKKVSSYLTDIIFKPKYETQICSYNGLKIKSIDELHDKIIIKLTEDRIPAVNNEVVLWEKILYENTAIEVILV